MFNKQMTPKPKTRTSRSLFMVLLSLLLIVNLASATHDGTPYEEVIVYQGDADNSDGIDVGWSYWFYDEWSDYFRGWRDWIPSFPQPVQPPDTGGDGDVDCQDIMDGLGNLLDVIGDVNGMMNAESFEVITEFDPETGRAVASTTYLPGSQGFTDSLASKIKWKIGAEKRLDKLFKDAANCNEKTP